MGRRLMLLGPPGAGKGTQAELVASAMDIPHVSTGAALRGAAAGTELGKKAAAIMRTGELVPDELVSAIVAERISEADAQCGYLLDGYPRNPGQAAALAEMENGELDVVVLIEADESELVDRLLKRAAEEGRSDDNETTIRRRLEVYRDQTEPLIALYEPAGVLRRVDGVGTVEEVFGRLMWELAR